ncbi:MAG: endolytic transglycosylase MltG [Erysipelotrichia bacterium]|nr:endolytic transglycosylase MltG [Erysipelotrichia bacterium]
MNNKKTNKKVKLIIGLAIVVVILIGVLFVYRYYLDQLKPVSEKSEQVIFTIDDGSYMNDVIDNLYEEGLIKDTKIVKLYVKLNKRNTYYAGNYLLNKNMSVKEIFDALADVNNSYTEEVTVTIVDGDWAKDAASAIADKTNLTKEEILDKWNDLDYIYSLISKYDFLTEDIFNSEHCYLEGFIYPNTYNFYKQTTVEEVTEKILNETDRVYQKYAQQIKQSGYSTYQIYTLASMILFEANNQEDMRLVSSVFHNRLNDNYPLQSSVTVCYALYTYDSWQECETSIDIDSKYNTYVYDGLPIGPVCNPNEMALEAALNPAESNYYYFLADVDTGKVYFAETYAEHLRNIEKYLN